MARKRAVIVALIVVTLAAPFCWQIASSEIANSELQEDLRDLASQNATRLGLSAASTDEDFRNRVVQEAGEHGIRLRADQVTVERAGTDDAPAVNLGAEYTVRIGMLGFSYEMHFQARAEGKPLEPLRDAR